MNLLAEKTKDVTRTLLPVVILVLLLCFTLVDVESNVFTRFLVGSVMLLIGLSIFLWGVDLAMNPIGEHMSREIATSRTFLKIAILSFLLGFLITVAEPDMLVLGSQIEAASGGVMSASVIVYMVSIGVGVLISLGVFRLLGDMPLNRFMMITYGVIFILAIFVSEEFLAIAFDSSGATTGALTTPFILAISLGLSIIKGGRHSEENAFGLVGIMSAGPILAVMLLSVLTGQKNIQSSEVEFIVSEGVLGPIMDVLPTIFFESIIALLPITILFFIFNFTKFKLSEDELSRIIKGLLLTLVGLVLFLTAAASGFMDMGRIIGMELAGMNKWLLIGIGFLMGLIVVLVEPAVHVLGQQIEEVTGGHIPLNLIRITLSIGVGLAIALSMVRIVVPEVKLWYFIIPGFAMAIVLSFVSEPVFVGIAYDAGGVASGPMTATFVLAFAQGAASVIESADVMIDGFGVIAMVAMAPVFSLMVLGTLFRHTRVEYPAVEDKEDMPSPSPEDELQHNCIMAIVNRGFAESVVDAARLSGATGATIIHGRGTHEDHKVLLPIIHVELHPEKEIVLLITGAHLSETIADNLLGDPLLAREGEIAVFIAPTTEAIVKIPEQDTLSDGAAPQN
ncbi:MAG: DUF1538 family protein [Dethiobacteria bacterium]